MNDSPMTPQSLTLENDYLRARFIPRGASLVDLVYKPKSVQVCPDLPNTASQNYIGQNYIGTVIGPIANRVAHAQYNLDGRVIHLDANASPHSLHSGANGISEVDWQVIGQGLDYLEFRLISNADDSGQISEFTALYTIQDTIQGATLSITLSARGIGAGSRVFNLTPHVYFNLMGQGDIHDHSLRVCAACYLPVDSDKIPTGVIAKVTNTPFDLQTARNLAGVLSQTDLDHNFCLTPTPELIKAVELSAPNGIHLSVLTNQQGVQIYDGAHLNFTALAIEPQGWPNAVNTPAFPSQTVKQGAVYRNHSQFIFTH